MPIVGTPPKKVALTTIGHMEVRRLPKGDLSKSMRRTLLDLLRSPSPKVSTTTQSALRVRGLVGDNLNLTESGFQIAVSLAALEEQCRALSLPLSKITLVETTDGPERMAFSHFRSLGYDGAYCEGGMILILIRAAALDYLASVNDFSSRQDACTRFTEAQLHIHADEIDAICDHIEHSDVTSVRHCFREIYKNLMVQEAYPGLTEKAVAMAFEAIGAQLLSRIARTLASDPYKFRSGWPDLTLVTPAREMLWCEVKTSDRLHLSQIATISRFRGLLPGQLMVLRVESN